MNEFSIAKIFLSQERGLLETESFRTYSTFHFGSYQNENKTAVESLYVLNDETLAGGNGNQYLVEEDSLIVLLPLVGAIECNIDRKAMVQAGELLASFVRKGTAITINNPYENQLVNYLQLWFKQDVTAKKGVAYFDIDSNKNQLVNILQSGIKLSIGKFVGRKEAIYKLSQDKSVFVFVIQGAFEVQHRLLENRDGLWLKNLQEIEMEALSNDAILFLIEMS